METFTSHMTNSVGGTILPLGNLRHICLTWSSISGGCLRTLLKSCPQLESLEYEAGGPYVGFDQFSIARMIKFLSLYAPRLKRLDLDFQDDPESEDLDDDEGDDEHDFEPAPGFASLSHLETLVVKYRAVVQPIPSAWPEGGCGVGHYI
ncbi:hypothetical protein C8A01DRAFT_37407 [Parachaetomium inaequale]|uniref:F-box protein n=1 Tax=Parachaetomium inaequale TaxID=2588326 RepID=A0AAN6PET8_9PEZI|nr:hypothetical protein C8A01DRAFT_37407 [Parachaetomium inaequale]